MFLPSRLLAQTVTGNVRSADNEPMPGVTVAEKGQNNITTTDEKGQFTLKLIQQKATLRFTSLASEPLEIIYKGQTTIEAVLRPRNNSLDEVHVIAYGTSTQRTNVGSITKVSGKDLMEQPITNPLAGLEGKVPGLTVVQTSGVPGASVNIQVRGQNTLNADFTQAYAPINQPLIIVDGVPYAAQNGNVNQFSSLASPGIGPYNNNYGGISPMNGLNPADIESIEVLRDADATAIYGARGGNGVILITTKKGKLGKATLNVNLNDGESVIGHTMPMMNTQQYLQMRHQAFVNDGLTPNNIPFDPGYAPDLTAFDTTRYTDWKKYFLGNTAHNLNLNASVSGGTTNDQYRLATGYNQDTYITPGDFADNRATVSTSLHHNSENKRFSLDFTADYGYEKNNSSGNPALLAAYTLVPDYPALTDKAGNLIWNYNGVSLDGTSAQTNPAAYLKQLYNIQNISLNANLQLGYKIVDRLTFRTSLGYSTYNSKEYNGVPLASQNPEFSPQAAASFGNNDFMTWLVEPQLEYKASIKKADFDVLVGNTLEKQTNALSAVQGIGYSNDDLIQSISGSASQIASDQYSLYKYIAFFGRLNIKYDNKYIVSLTGNHDGSSRFGPSRQFGNFGSVGGAWLFNEEKLIRKTLPFLSYGKLRGSYGSIGNDNGGNYQFLPRWAPSTTAYGGVPGYIPQNLYNPDFTWASTKKLEFGIELGFLKDRVLISSTWYRSRTGNQLVTYSLPTQTGFGSVFQNENALVQNSGWEFVLHAAIIKKEQFSWNSSFNMTIPSNKLLAFANLANSSYSETYQIGKPLTEVYGFRYAGVNPTDGYFQFYDANGQLTENPVLPQGGSFQDFVPVSKGYPDFYGGWQNNFKYGQFQLDVFLQYAKQTGMNYLGSVYSFLPGLQYNQPVALQDEWKSPGQTAPLQVLSSQQGQALSSAQNFIQSSGVYSDASYVRVKTIAFSYTLPSGLLKKIQVQNLRIYISAQNLFTITRYRGNDPETQIFYGVPPLKTVSCGIQTTF
ncbi:MAG: SusC/RagA family TonB-linked outer membrane protein [Bacteroidetes bacterium]|nr:SusC/RagA family TonB-linked outer membrane protein [Bacteroidota bacterium]